MTPKKAISIRLPEWILNDLKKEVSHDILGRGYQQLIEGILTAWVNETEPPPRYLQKPQAKKRKKSDNDGPTLYEYYK